MAGAGRQNVEPTTVNMWTVRLMHVTGHIQLRRVTGRKK